MTFHRSFLYPSQALLLYLLFTFSFTRYATFCTAQQVSDYAVSSNPVSEHEDAFVDHELKTDGPSSVPSSVRGAELLSSSEATDAKSHEHTADEHSTQIGEGTSNKKSSLTRHQGQVSPSAAANEEDYAYVAFYKGEGFGTDQGAISVSINGVPALGILLYNSTMLSFRIPSDFLTDHKLFVSSYVEIRLASQRLAHLPLNVLKSAISRVSLAQYRLSASEAYKPQTSWSNSISSSTSAQPNNLPQSLKLRSDESTSSNNGESLASEYKPINIAEESDTVVSRHVATEVHVSSEVTSSHDADVRNNAGGYVDVGAKYDGTKDESDKRVDLVSNDGSSTTDLDKDENQEGTVKTDENNDDNILEVVADTMEELKPDDLAVSPDTNMNIERDRRVEELIQQANLLLLSNRIQSNRQAIRLLEQAHDAGNVTASTTLGSIYLAAPVGVYRDLKKAAFYLQKASAAGFSDAQALLGFLYASGFAAPHVPMHIGAALLLWTFAAEGGSVIARMALAYRYFTGTDVAENCSRSAALYKLVADEVYNAVMEENAVPVHLRPLVWDEDTATVEILPPKGYNIPHVERKHLTEDRIRRIVGENHEIVQYYQHSADRGDTNSQLVMGQLYYYGAEGVPQNPEQARRLFNQAAEFGLAEAHAHLGYMDLREGKNESAVKHLSEAASREERLGLHGMGYVLLRGIGGKKDPKQAVQYFLKAAGKRHPEAMFNLGVLYAKGVGVTTQSARDSFNYFFSAAEYGHLQSNYKVGVMMLKGLLPAKKDCQQGTRHLKFVAERGMWTIVLSRALRAYERNQYNDALYRYLLAAHVGIEVGQYNAAFMYEHRTIENVDSYHTKLFERGKEVWKGKPIESARDERKTLVERALDLYQMSASQNMPEAMVRLGDLAFGEANDYKRAALAYEKAVGLRNAEAMFNLGMMHARGFGMNADKHMAKRYFDQAMEHDMDAKIPATIALFLLRYSERVGELWNMVVVYVDRARNSVFYLFQTDNKPVGNEEEIEAIEAVEVKRLRRKSTIDNSPHKSSHKGGIFAAFESLLNFIYTMDVFAISVLLGLLAVVVNARQRRIVEVNRNNVDDGQNGPEGDGPAEPQREVEGRPENFDDVQPIDGQA